VTIYYEDESVRLYHGDCIEVMRQLPDASVDAVVTDPPYGLEFMGKEWDSFGDVARANRGTLTNMVNANGSPKFAMKAPAFDLTTGGMATFQSWCTEWATEALRVLKPGGHLLAFGGTRTWHRLACAIEDAGFEVRDSLAYMYGSGFPKSLNVSKALRDNRCQCFVGQLEGAEPPTEHDVPRLSVGDVPEAVPARAGQGPLLLAGMSEQGAPTAGRSQLPAAADGLGEPGVEGRRDVQAPEGQLRRPALRPVPAGVSGDGEDGRLRHGAPSSDGAQAGPRAAADGSREPHQPRPEGQQAGEPGVVPEQRGSQTWGGWTVCARCGKPSIPDGLGTALKPAFEPIVVARKPLIGTVAANVERYGTGALNIDGGRVGFASEADERESKDKNRHADFGSGPRDNKVYGADTRDRGSNGNYNPPGRWPANVILDESQARELDRQSGVTSSGSRKAGDYGLMGYMGADVAPMPEVTGDTGGASRFFYTAKADSSERPRVDGVAHPTVKPLDLMRYLVRLVTPPGGVVLEPFAGSGTTLEACIVEGFRCIGIEREADYIPLIMARITKPIEVTLL
jgi:DNA modification methylase